MSTRGRRPHVGCNLLWLVPGVVGGSEEYTIGLLRAWAARADAPTDPQLVLFVNRALVERYRDLVQGFPTVVAPTAGRHKVGRVAAENSWLAYESGRHRVTVMHHLGGVMPIVARIPGMVTVHDLQPWAMPEHFALVKRAYLHATVPHAVRHALAVITLSRFAADDLVERFGVDRRVMALVPPGLEVAAGDSAEAAEARRVYELGDRPYFLYPAITYAHKNHLVLVRAFAEVVARHPEAVLVLTGGEGPVEHEVRAAVDALGVAHRVRRTGRIPAEHLRGLYRGAAALTFPSRYEGFGLPVLEAMTYGCPVLASAVTALPEVVGAGGELLDPDAPGAWATAMHRVLDDAGYRADLVARGRTRVGTFDWASSVDAYRAVLDRVCGTVTGG